MEGYQNRYCHDLPSRPIKGHKVLVTGATGYIGGELIPELVARGYHVRILVRSMKPEFERRWPSAEIVIADVLNYENLEKSMNGIQTAYYFVHSFYKRKNFQEIDIKAAWNFQKAADSNNLERIIYLGGLGDKSKDLSAHLKSRILVAETLKEGNTPVTFLRAAVVIGSGSSSYKIIKNLVAKCPVFVFPVWGKSPCQPIAIRDAIKYLVGCLEINETSGKNFDIGGPDVVTYAEMLKFQAQTIGKKRLYINSPLSSVKFYTEIASRFTPVSKSLIGVLFESCRNQAICKDSSIRKFIPIKPISYLDSLEWALKRESQENLFKNKQTFSHKDLPQETSPKILKPPSKSTGFFSDVRIFMLNKPNIPTLVKLKSDAERENYTFRILQRLGAEVDDYRILNVHKIGVNAPAKYIFEELLDWDGDSTCWPNHLAKIVKHNNKLENLLVYLFGWVNFPEWFKNSFIGKSFIPLFKLNAIRLQKFPEASDADNARFLFYKSSGGYPIGIFTMYVRSSISRQNEVEQSQLFLMVGFNFYGKEKWSKRNPINRLWEFIHNRVTSNVLHRIKQLSEWRFAKIQSGE